MTSAVGRGAAAAADWTWDHRYEVGGVLLAGACVAVAVTTAGLVGAARLTGGGVLLGSQVVEAGLHAAEGPGFAYGQFFGEAGLATFQTGH